MARIRSIKPEFWVSEQVVECSMNARLLFVALWNFCDDKGRHRASPKTLKAEAFPIDLFSPEDIAGWINELWRVGLIDTYETPDGVRFWQVTGWHHQKIDRPQAPKFPDPSACIRIPFDEHSTNIRRPFVPDGGMEGSEGIGMDRKGRDLSLCRLRATESRTTAIEELKNAWNQTPGVVQARQITGKRLAAAKARLADPDWPWKEALAKFPLRCFQGDGDWKPNLDWFLRPDSALKCVEGGYDWAKENSNGKSAAETLKEQNERAIAEGIRIAAERKRQRELAQ